MNILKLLQECDKRASYCYFMIVNQNITIYKVACCDDIVSTKESENFGLGNKNINLVELKHSGLGDILDILRGTCGSKTAESKGTLV